MLRSIALLLLLLQPSWAVINYYVNTGSTAGGDGTTNNTSGSTRAFASLSEALGVIDNATLTDNVFVYCSGSAADTTAITTIDVDTSSYMLTITTTGAQRHKGKWDTGIYRLEVSSGSYAFRNNTTLRMTVDGLQIKLSAANAYAMKLIGANHAGSFDVTYSNNLIWATTKTSTTGLIIDAPASGTGTARVINNIVYGFNQAFGGAATSWGKFWNNTVADCNYGAVPDSNPGFELKNNLIKAATGGIVGTLDSASDYNATSDGSATGTHSRTTQTFTFLDESGADYRLSVADAGAKDFGVTDPSGASYFSTDINGYSRSGTWDMGAWEAHSSVALSGTVTSSITESDIVTGGKTIILTVDGDQWVPANGTPTFNTATSASTVSADGRDGNGDVTVNWPTGYTATAGHFALMPVYLDQGASTTPSGWSLVTGSPFGSGTEKLYIFYKVLAGGDSTPTITISSSAAGASTGAAMTIWTGVGSIGAIGTGNQGTGTPMTATGVTTTDDNSIVVHIAGRGDNETSASQTFNSSSTGVTERLDAGTNGGNDSQLSIAAKTFASSGSASGDGSSTTSATDPWVSVMLELKRSAPFAGVRQAVINGMDSAQAEGTGWDAVVKAGQTVGGVVRTSDSVLTITLDAFATYNISSTETTTVTVPASALLGGSSVVASPTFTISAAAGGSARRRKGVVAVQ